MSLSSALEEAWQRVAAVGTAMAMAKVTSSAMREVVVADMAKQVVGVVASD